MTSSIRVQRVVLQGDGLSPILFNLINTLINTMKSEKIECMGYFYQNCFRPKHWFQFADDTAIVTTLDSDNQHLCNVFLKWTSWTDLANVTHSLSERIKQQVNSFVNSVFRQLSKIRVLLT